VQPLAAADMSEYAAAKVPEMLLFGAADAVRTRSVVT
jgi:hypothetical protein